MKKLHIISGNWCKENSTVAPLLFALESITSKLATREISIFWLIYVAEPAGLGMTTSHTVVFFFNLSKQYKQSTCNIQFIESYYLNLGR